MIRKAHKLLTAIRGIRRFELNPGSLMSICVVPISPFVRAQLERAATQRRWSGVVIIPPAGEGPPARAWPISRKNRQAIIWFDPSRSSVDALSTLLDKLDILAKEEDDEKGAA